MTTSEQPHSPDYREMLQGKVPDTFLPGIVPETGIQSDYYNTYAGTMFALSSYTLTPEEKADKQAEIREYLGQTITYSEYTSDPLFKIVEQETLPKATKKQIQDALTSVPNAAALDEIAEKVKSLGSQNESEPLPIEQIVRLVAKAHILIYDNRDRAKKYFKNFGFNIASLEE